MSKKHSLGLLLLVVVILSFLFGAWFYSNPQARKKKIDEYKREIMKKERRFWNLGPSLNTTGQFCYILHKGLGTELYGFRKGRIGVRYTYHIFNS